MPRRLWLVVAALVAGCGTDPAPPSGPAALAIVGQPPTAVASGSPLGTDPVLGLVDQAGNPVASRGVLISVEVASGTVTLAGAREARTDAAGRAAFPALVLTGPIGPKTLRFSATGLTSATSSPINLTAGQAGTMALEEGNNQTAPAGTELPVAPAVKVLDQSGNPVPGVAVTFAVTSGGGSLEGGSATTGADGIARATKWILGPVVGLNGLSASAGSIQQLFSATGIVGAAAKMIAVAGDSQTAVIGDTVVVAPSVKVTDAFDNPIAGVLVSFTPSAGGTVTGGNPQTDAAGVARVGGWTLSLISGIQTLTSSKGGIIPVVFTATAQGLEVQKIAAGASSSCAVSPTGIGYCWGDNSFGQLGDSSNGDSKVPVRVKSGSIVFTSIDVGGVHACGLTASGAAHCWGNNQSGQLGDGSGADSNAPVAVAGGHVFTSMALGDLHTCGLHLDGSAWCWGNNDQGRLGDGTFPGREEPVAVAGGLTFTRLAAGGAHTCGLVMAGALYCWGANAQGRLGDGTTTNRNVPTLVSAVGTTFSAVTAGDGHTCALTASGVVMCWGIGGALGNGTTAGHPTPAAVSGTTLFTAIAAGLGHTCGLTATGTLFCWGQNGSGRLGDGTIVNKLVPTAVAGSLLAGSMDLGFEHTCAITLAGSAVCWGRNLEGQLGDGSVVSSLKPKGVKSP